MVKLISSGILLLLTINFCKAYVALEPKIVGGTNATQGIAPFIVSIQHRGSHYCGGSILNSHWVLTAAHCALSPTIVKEMTLLVGTNNFTNVTGYAQRRNIDYHKVHQGYAGSATVPGANDLALMFTSEPFKWNAVVKPVKLPKPGYVASGYGNLYGWGSVSTSVTPLYPKTLQEAKNLPIISLKACKKALGIAAQPLNETNLCTGPIDLGIQSCSADSGGPLVQAGEDRLLVGVVSWGPVPCGHGPSVFVEVADFLDWISEQQRDLYKKNQLELD